MFSSGGIRTINIRLSECTVIRHTFIEFLTKLKGKAYPLHTVLACYWNSKTPLSHKAFIILGLTLQRYLVVRYGMLIPTFLFSQTNRLRFFFRNAAVVCDAGGCVSSSDIRRLK